MFSTQILNSINPVSLLKYMVSYLINQEDNQKTCNPTVSEGASGYLPAMPEAGGQQAGQARAW